ncbi:MAG: tRNA (cytidine(34)-2'-O)-methyltransferase [Acholeplasmatales bacterium]|jgi:tRNA (cytidine/uridine-2'-O-)-methyltransferase|nr:tRNA (cytidine(34)-2'-O)-methyltransferase [Acholeplasmatales bacterium]
MINIVLYEPEIPQNTGNIMRTCVAINAVLHIIKPLGFSLEDKYLKRSHLDYIDFLKYYVYENYEDFITKNNNGKFYFLTRYGYNCYTDIDYKEEENIYLVFGKESTGISKDILASNLEHTFRIPTSSNVRSLNLSNCVALVSYSLLSKADFPSLEKYEPEKLKGKDFLKQFIKNS